MRSRVLIVEDDVIISEVLRQIVQSAEHDVIGICADEKSAIERANFDKPDFALLDIKLLGHDLGTNVAKELNKINIPFAFITSYADKQTIQEAVILGPKGYLMKPFEKAEVLRILKHLSESTKQTIPLKSMGVTDLIDLNDIIYVKSDNVYLEVYTTQKKYISRQKLSDFEAFVPNRQFIRVHRSFLVNRDYVESFSPNEIVIDGESIPVSRKYRSDISAYF